VTTRPETGGYKNQLEFFEHRNKVREKTSYPKRRVKGGGAGWGRKIRPNWKKKKIRSETDTI